MMEYPRNPSLVRPVRAAILLLGLMLWTGVAHSDLANCVEGVLESSLDPEAIKKDAEFLANYGYCLPFVTNPSPEFKGMVGALVGLKAAGEFDDLSGCEAIKNKAATDIAAVLGPAAQAVMAQYSCACAVVEYGEERFKQLKEIVEACGGVVEDIGKVVGAIVSGLEDGIDSAVEAAEAFWEWFNDALEAVACWFIGLFGIECDPPPQPGTPIEWYFYCQSKGQVCGDLGCLGVNCSVVGQQCGGPQHDTCVPCGEVKFATGTAAGFCGCQGGLEPEYQQTPGGHPLLLACTCPAPLSIITDPFGSNNPHCGCPGGKIVIDNECRCPPDQITLADGQCYCPAEKVKVGLKCVTPCADPTQVLLKDGTCCKPSQTTSCGLCCPEGQKPDTTGGSCVSASPTTDPPKLIPVTIVPQQPAATQRTAP